jgi:hypothetical protein
LSARELDAAYKGCVCAKVEEEELRAKSGCLISLTVLLQLFLRQQ